MPKTSISDTLHLRSVFRRDRCSIDYDRDGPSRLDLRLNARRPSIPRIQRTFVVI